MKFTVRNTLLTLTLTSLVTFSGTSLASGGGGFDTSGFSSQRIDQQYELGKSYYSANQPNGSQLQYCVKKGSELNKLSRRSVRSFKRGPASAFIDSLYNCNNPNERIADLVADDQGDAILYYLNKRFKLRLSNG